MAELGVGLAVVAEPYRVPAGHPQWAGATDGSVACTWRFAGEEIGCTPIGAGNGYVSVEWGSVIVVGVYFSPRLNRAAFETGLDDIGDFIRSHLPAPVLLAGDFNAKSALWGSSRPNLRGRILEEWAVALGLVCLNEGNVSTCVRAQGESIVDVTWASPALARGVRHWRVRAEMETLSDHAYITMEVELRGGLGHRSLGRSAQRDTRPRRWTVSKLDVDKLVAALLVYEWPAVSEESDVGLSEEVETLRERIHDACDVAMPRSSPRPLAATYWWSGEIAEMRRTAIAKRRRWKRSRGTEREVALREDYRTARYTLCAAINKAKSGAWDELLRTLNSDPWGRPYKIVREKLRRWAPPVAETLNVAFLSRVVATLFPGQDGEEEGGTRGPPQLDWNEDWSVKEEELSDAVRKMRSRNAAPGPDGIHGKVLATVHKVIGSRIRGVMTRCLREGVFPAVWKRANLVLLRKAGKLPDSPSAYRPICLLDELGKLFERVLASRLTEHLSRTGPDLHKNQFGFRKGRSTVDAIRTVKSTTEQAMGEGKVVMAISLDIVNAFNTLPWPKIMTALEEHGVPPYLRRVLRDYLDNRWLQYKNKEGTHCEKRVERGVPQGSVLGPHLWDVGYDVVLSEVALPPGCTAMCYADDTIILAAGRDWHEAKCRAEDALAGVIGAIRGLSLEVAPQKTEAMWFHDGSHGPPPEMRLGVCGTMISVGSQMKYLGLIIDTGWSFEPHFDWLAPRLTKAANQMSGLMPNLSGPGGRARRLYATALTSMALYGAPIWAETVSSSNRNKAHLRRALRVMAIRVIRGYRTVSFVGATMLAGLAPLDLMAARNAEVYERTRKMRERLGRDPSDRVCTHIREQASLRLRARWLAWLNELGPYDSGLRIREAVLPWFGDWVDRRWGDLSFRVTQILSGHGCFGSFLSRIGRDPTPECTHCGEEVDSPQHTLEVCPMWETPRGELTRVIGRDLSASALIGAMLASEDHWDAVSTFCNVVMTAKEEAERERRGEGPPRHRADRGPRRPGRVPRPYRPRLAHMRDR